MAASLSYKFDLEKTGGVEAVVAGLGSVTDKVEGADSEIKKLQTHLNALKAPGEIAKLKKDIADFGKPAVEHFKGVGAAIEETSNHLHHFMEFVGAGLVLEGLKKGTEFVADLGKEILGAAAGAERLDLSFKLTLGNEGAEEVLGWLDKIAGKTEFTDDQLKNWTLQLANAGVKASELDKFVAAGLDVAGKRGPAAMEMAIDALGRANLTGQVEGRVLRGLGIPVADLGQLDQFKGLNEKQINKKLETTQISKDDLLSLIAGPDKMLGDIGIQAGDTLEAKLKNLKGLPDQFFQQFANSPAYDALKVKLDDLLVTFDPSGPRGKEIFSALETVFSAVVEQVKQIDFKAAGDVLVTQIIPAVKELAGLIAPVAEGVLRIARGFGVMIDTVKPFVPAIKTAVSTSINVATLGTAPIASAIGKKFFSPAAPTEPAVPVDPIAEARGQEAAAAYAKGMLGGRDFVAFAGSAVGQTSIDALNSSIERHSPPAVFVRAGRDIPRAIALGIEDEGPTVDTAMREAMTLPERDALTLPETRGGAGGLPGTGGGIEINITLQMGAGADRQQADQAAKVIGDALEERLAALLERMTGSMGAAI